MRIVQVTLFARLTELKMFLQTVQCSEICLELLTSIKVTIMYKQLQEFGMRLMEKALQDNVLHIYPIFTVFITDNISVCNSCTCHQE